ncbi:response regulator [Sabulicella rubraurantiaca]|uniref:response regulator n=1 Tax=Sabulicella rubraurantiaca TaxID=2811429 RepID=UPI001A9748CA|nr:response regulator [Sabulicella rubraurantiaca]
MRFHSGESPGGPGPCQVLVVEDEAVIALQLELILTDAGFVVIGPAPTVAAAMALLASQRPDAAVLDVNLHGERVTPVAEALTAMGVPFVLSSAYDAADLASDAVLAGARNVGKPIKLAVLLEALRGFLDRR